MSGRVYKCLIASTAVERLNHVVAFADQRGSESGDDRRIIIDEHISLSLEGVGVFGARSTARSSLPSATCPFFDPAALKRLTEFMRDQKSWSW